MSVSEIMDPSPSIMSLSNALVSGVDRIFATELCGSSFTATADCAVPHRWHAFVRRLAPSIPLSISTEARKS